MARALVTGSGDRVNAVAGLLSARGLDVLTAGSAHELPREPGSIDYYVQCPPRCAPNSRLALLHVLAHAARAELSPYGVRVVVLSGARSDADVVRFALHGGPDDPAARVVAELAVGGVSDKQYQDWRTEVMGLLHA